jgi:hypothetical protein
MCDLETSRMRRLKPASGKKKKKMKKKKKNFSQIHTFAAF